MNERRKSKLARLGRAVLSPGLAADERRRLAEVLGGQLSDVVADDRAFELDLILDALEDRMHSAQSPETMSALARGLCDAHFELVVGQELHDHRSQRLLSIMRKLVSGPEVSVAAQLALADTLACEIGADCWAGAWTTALQLLDELRGVVVGLGVEGDEPLADALSAVVYCAASDRPDWGGRVGLLAELRRVVNAAPQSAPKRAALAEALSRELVLAVSNDQHVLCYTLLLEIHDAVGDLCDVPLGLMPETLCAAVLKAARARRFKLALACLEAVRVIVERPEATRSQRDLLAEAIFCCFVRLKGDDKACAEGLLSDLRQLANGPESSPTQRLYFAHAVANQHFDAGESRDWSSCDRLLDELRWLVRSYPEEDALCDEFAQMLGTTHYDAWRRGQVTRAERAFVELYRYATRDGVTTVQRRQLAKALNRRHADATETDDWERADGILRQLRSMAAHAAADDAIRYEYGDAITLAYQAGCSALDLVRVRMCREAFESLCATADDDRELRALMDSTLG